MAFERVKLLIVINLATIEKFNRHTIGDGMFSITKPTMTKFCHCHTNYYQKHFVANQVAINFF
jgi:hypothetical protein